MFTGDPSTHNAPWLVSTSASTHTNIPPVVEVDEDEPQPGFQPFITASRDNEQSLSSGILSQDTRTHIHNSRSAPTSLATTSASPAATFLSFFHSPSPAPEPDGESSVVAGYTLGPIIGYGGTSIIRRANSSSGTTAAVKIVRRADLVKAGNAPQARKRLQHEAAVWATLTHEHILPLFTTVHTSYADYFFTLYCPAGSLFDILKRDGSPALLQDDAGMMFRQVVRGLRYLHEDACYVHRDMKLENVLVDEMGLCKIGDFGMSRRIGMADDESDDDEGSDTATAFPGSGNGALHRAVSLAAPARRQPKGNFDHIMRHNSARHRNSTSTNEPAQHYQPGSLPYAAPEILLPQTSDASRPHPSQDIWALGVMLYALLTGRLPFIDSFEPRLQMKILKGTYEIPEGIGRGAERILQGCLEKSPTERWTIAMVDDVAWGVGWGAEGDYAHVAHDDTETAHPPPVSASRSKSRSRPAGLSIPEDADWTRDEPRSRSSRAAASRRSSSRAQRSLSRAPISTPPSHQHQHPHSAHRRSPSRYPRSHSRPAALSAGYPPSSTSSAAEGHRAGFDEYALEVSPSPPASVPRGRWRGNGNGNGNGNGHDEYNGHAYENGHGHGRGNRHASASRSPSPSVVPTTPLDGARVAMPALAHPDEMNLDSDDASPNSDPARGRAAMRTAHMSPPIPLSLPLPIPLPKSLGGARGVPLLRSDSLVSSASQTSSLEEACAHVVAVGEGVARLGVGVCRGRPTSSPPTGPRTPHGGVPKVGAGMGMGAGAGMQMADTFLRATEGGGGLTAASLLARSRSADPGR